MEYRNLGRSGLKLSALSFGSWVTFKNQVDLSLAKEMMTVAYDAGVNFFDNAEVYADGESEKIMGQALKELGWGRDTFTVSSKVFWGGSLPTQKGLNRKHIHDACHAALGRLQVDYLDLFFCHRPDASTPIEETVRAMDVLIQQGKILYWGTSEWTVAQIMDAHRIAGQYGLTPPTMEQPEYNLFHRERMEGDYLHAFNTVGLGTTIWSPLASGLLTGKYIDGMAGDSRVNLKGYGWLKAKFESEKGQELIGLTKELKHIANDLGISLAQLSLAWTLKNPNVSTAIIGASKVSQLQENLKAIDSLDLLTDEVMDNIEKVVKNKPAPQDVF